MLSLLHIENIAVIESADISFGKGFNVLTGETGAGKSIVIDAIGALLGERTSRDLIRTGARTALVSAVFSGVFQSEWLEACGFSADENAELLIQREVQQDGKNLCRVMGRPCTVAQLRELGAHLINIHGQHDGQQLLDERCHLGYLDRFGALEGQTGAFSACFLQVRAISAQLDALHMDETEKARRMDTLRYQIRELERAELTAGEDEALAQRRALLRGAEKLMNAVEEAERALAGDEERDGAAALLAAAGSALAPAARVSAEAAGLADRAAELRYAADDLAAQVAELREKLDCSPEELDRIEGRLDLLYRLRRKYGGSAEEMLAYLERCRGELDEIETADDTAARLEGKLREALAEARKSAAALSQARRDSAAALELRVQDELAQLDMPRVRFSVEFQPKDGEFGMDSTGMDAVQFLMSANVGEALRPIQRVASGGELARIMLALKNVLAENEDVATLIFDEVDSGVSGRAAARVAEKMSDVARTRQVLCVTHLPQIAAMADEHFSVEKSVRDSRTFTCVCALDRAQRCAELARITGGDAGSEALLRGADELLRRAQAYKEKRKK